MKVFICIDDTDNLESIGTGHLAARLAADLEEKNWGKSSFITRHQLFVHPDVPYTSHNSAMCFEADLHDAFLSPLIDHAASFLKQHSAPGSDPGLCVAVADRLKNPARIIAFGNKAKHQVLGKAEAFALAQQHGLHLSEHGGTGDGIIGALAGVGLRLGKNDGRVRGKLQVTSVNNTASVADILSQVEVADVTTMSGRPLGVKERISLGEWVKAVFIGGSPVLLVEPLDPPQENASWRICTKEELRRY